MTIETLTRVAPTVPLYECSICGALTEWDFSLGDEPQCVACWDSRLDIEEILSPSQRAYYRRDKDSYTAYQRAYYQKNKERLVAYKRANRQKNRCVLE